MNELLERLRGGLIVSVQADAGSLLDTPETIALLARCAVQNGAAGLRVESALRISAVRAALPGVPLIGIVKRAHPGFEPYITSTAEEVAEVAAAGADVVAFDATARPRAAESSVADLVAAAHERGLIAMGDCSEAADAAAATAAGAEIVATTLAGYTAATQGLDQPALELLAALVTRHPFAVCEGGIATPQQARAAFEAGASAIVVGTAITNVDALVRRFVLFL